VHAMGECYRNSKSNNYLLKMWVCVLQISRFKSLGEARPNLCEG